MILAYDRITRGRDESKSRNRPNGSSGNYHTIQTGNETTKKSPFGTWLKDRIEGRLSERKNTVIFAHDWGNDGAEVNIQLLCSNIAQACRCDLEFVRVPGISPLESPLRAAVELDRILDTQILALEGLVRNLRHAEIEDRKIKELLPRLALVNVFDRAVGGERVPVIGSGKVVVEDGFAIKVALIGPIENGIINFLARRFPHFEAYALENEEFQLPKNCATWDGRAVFGPAAAWFVSGINPEYFGRRIAHKEFPSIVLGYTQEASGRIRADIIDIDCIGNLVIGVPNSEIAKLPEVLRIIARKQIAARRGNKFSDVPRNNAVFYPGSNGYVELAINGGSIARSLGLGEVELGLREVRDSSLELRSDKHIDLMPIG